MLNLLKNIWGIYWYLIFIGVFFVLSPILFLMLAIAPLRKHVNWFRVQWGRLTFGLTLMPWKIQYAEAYKDLKKDKNRKGIIFCPNHTSFMDIPLFGVAIGGNMKFFAKKELTKLPLFGQLVAIADIPVDRSSRRESLKALINAGEALEEKVNLCIFPEGTTNNNGRQLMDMKMGAFKLAIEKQVPIVPVTFLDNFRLFLNDGKHRARPGQSNVIVHDPIVTTGMTKKDLPALAEQVKQTIQTALDNKYESR